MKSSVYAPSNLLKEYAKDVKRLANTLQSIRENEEKYSNSILLEKIWSMANGIYNGREILIKDVRTLINYYEDARLIRSRARTTLEQVAIVFMEALMNEVYDDEEK